MSALGFSAEQILAFLQLGISGVAFVFLAMSFILLRNEQVKKDKPRENILSSIRQFSRLSLVFALLVAAMMVLDLYVQKEVVLSLKCKASLERARLLAMNKTPHSIESLHQLLNNTLAQCE